MKSPIQQAIECLTNSPDIIFKLDKNQVALVREYLRHFLPAEREVIEGAYNQGDEDRYDMSLLREKPKYKNSSDYFTQTYNNDNRDHSN